VYIEKNKGTRVGNRVDTTRIALAPEEKLAIEMDCVGESGQARKTAMIPACYPIHWTLCSTPDASNRDYGREIKQFIPDNTTSSRRPSSRQHPLAAHLFESIRFCDKLTIQHLVSGLERGSALERLSYKFKGKWAMFVDGYETQGIAFHLSDLIKDSIESYSKKMLDVPFETDHVEAWGLYLDEQGHLRIDEGQVDVFARQDFVDAQLHAVRKHLGKMPESLREFIETLNDQNLDLKTSIDDKIASKDDGRGGDTLRQLYNSLVGISYDFDETWFRDKWVCRTILNTLGGLLVEEGTTYSGVDQQKLGYAYDEKNKVIFLFDADAEGNGTVEMLNEFMHIPEAARAAQHVFNGERLPTEDFFTALERKMTLCSEHIIHTAAVIPNLRDTLLPADWKEEAKRLDDETNRSVWEEHDVTSTRLASLEARMIEFGDRQIEQAGTRDKKRQALDLCSFGCPICQATTNIIPYHAKRALTSRGLLDVIVSLSNAKEFVLVADKVEQFGEFEALLGKSNDEIIYHYTHENDSRGGYSETHVAIPTQIGIMGSRSSNGSDWGFLNRLAEEVKGDTDA
jgi:hypothetical protein